MVLAGLLTAGRAVGAARAKNETLQKLVMLIAEAEYSTAETLPAFAANHLEKDFCVVILIGSLEPGANGFDRIEEVASADLLLVSVRRRLLPPGQLDLIRRHVAAAKPVVGIRTASHAFAPSRNQAVPAGAAAWLEWDNEIMGGSYNGHYGNTDYPTITAAAPASPILRGLRLPYTLKYSLYRTSPLQPGAQPILMGTIPGHPSEPVAWTFTHRGGGRAFYTSLGIPEDFTDPGFNAFLRNAILWAAGSQ